MNKLTWEPENPHSVIHTETQPTAYESWLAGGEAYLKALIEFLFEPCTEHPTGYYSYPDRKSGYKYPDHRYQCEKCMQELKES